MKNFLVTGFLCIVLFPGCQSGDTSKRSDYSDANYDSLQPKIVERSKVLRSLDPKLTEQEAIAKAEEEFARERKQEKKKRQQKDAREKFEKDLSKSLEK